MLGIRFPTVSVLILSQHWNACCYVIALRLNLQDGQARRFDRFYADTACTLVA